jgi:putative membrane protein
MAPTAPHPDNPGGSFLRDRMANERTMLAWVRTAITLVALGLGLAKLGLFLQLAVAEHAPPPELLATFPDPRWSQTIAIGLVLLGGAVAGLGGYRTLRYGRIIDPNDRAPRNVQVLAVAWGTVLLSLVVLLYLVIP